MNAFFPGDVRSNLMPYTQVLTNTTVPVGAQLALSEQYRGKTGLFFDEMGQQVMLSNKKYSADMAERILLEELN